MLGAERITRAARKNNDIANIRRLVVVVRATSGAKLSTIGMISKLT
jgi:hypothetical protein